MLQRSILLPEMWMYMFQKIVRSIFAQIVDFWTEKSDE